MKHIQLLVFSLGILAFGCTLQGSSNETVVARVNDDVLLKSNMLKQIPSSVFQYRDSSEVINEFVNEWIRDRLLVQEAYRLRLHRDESVLNTINELTEQYLLEVSKQYITQELNPSLEVTIDEARDYYIEHKDSFLLNERFIRFRFFKAATLNDAARARQEILRGSSWENIVSKYALEPEYTLRHAERFWPISRAAEDSPIMNRYLRRIGISEISVIERIGDDYQFVQLMEEKPIGEHPDLEWLLEEIQEWLILEKKRTSFKSYMQNLYLQAEANNEIELNLEN
ncbi:MAG: peptidyl-prolyl cis-trans isomerase [Bacteroidetes bacterium]|nr:peptidyl-prolyl cis-trans isomerase [Bacteroidota bacterium]